MRLHASDSTCYRYNTVDQPLRQRPRPARIQKTKKTRPELRLPVPAVVYDLANDLQGFHNGRQNNNYFILPAVGLSGRFPEKQTPITDDSNHY
jgi:hypothetical protein